MKSKFMYAIVKSGGKQYKVQPGDKIKIEKLPLQIGDEVIFDQVLLKSNGNNNEGNGPSLEIGNPLLEGVIVKGRVLDQGRGEKVKVLKFRRRKHSMKSMGHRQAYSEIQIESIS